MTEICRLNIPTFDLVWCNFRSDNFVLLSGGGGSARSGVKNQVLFAKSISNKKYSFLNGYLTDSEGKSSLCSGLCCGLVEVELLKFSLYQDF
jgi:hypothetical protein